MNVSGGTSGKPTDSHHQGVADLRGGAVGRACYGDALRYIEDCLCSIEVVGRAVVYFQAIGELRPGTHRTGSLEVDVELVVEIGLRHDKFVEQDGRSIRGGRNHVSGGWIDERVGNGIVDGIAVDVGAERRRAGGRCGRGGQQGFRDLIKR